MFVQILVGFFVVSCSVVVEAGFIGAAIVMLRRMAERGPTRPSPLRLMLVLTGMTLWLLAALGVAIGIWAATFQVLNLFENFEEALYFSAVAFTTLGFGDITLDHEWRLLSGFIAANGLILFSETTAFLIELIRRMNEANSRT